MPATEDQLLEEFREFDPDNYGLGAAVNVA
jgi:hypothetical protein